jgi:hypothetical protein
MKVDNIAPSNRFSRRRTRNRMTPMEAEAPAYLSRAHPVAALALLRAQPVAEVR